MPQPPLIRLAPFLLATLLASAAGAGQDPAPDTSPDTLQFNRDIRPILSDRCFSCHGPDSNKRKSGLRLDRQDAAFDPLPKHTDKRAFVPGHPADSFAYQRMITTDEDEIMPPAKSHLKLNTREKDLIRKWIEQGAHWQEHWAFLKPIRPPVPDIADTAWPRNDIDHFILARLQREGRSPSPEADKPTLIRRVCLDLTGIPPTPAQVEAFLADQSPGAYEKLVDRLLASPHYGEQMAIAWLDCARYADSHGFQSDPERFMWHWRDWVINAFNANMPFDQFTIEQLAGDLLPNATDDQKIATGFNRNHRINSEGGVIDEEWHVETVIDRVETTSATFLGLTMGCCRCHDHKFDPITQKEFYSFYAFFNSINERGEYFSAGIDKGINAAPILKVFDADQKQHIADLTTHIASADARLKQIEQRLPDIEKKFIEDGGKLREPEGLLARFPLDEDPSGIDASGKSIPATLTGPATRPWTDGKISKALKLADKDASINAGDAIHFERTDAFTVGAWVNLQAPDGSIVNKMDEGPSFAGIDFFVQAGKVAPHFVHNWDEKQALKVMTRNSLPMKTWAHVMVTYDGTSKAAGVKIYFDGKPQETQTEIDKLDASILSKSPLLIGKRIASSPLTGVVDDVRFYNRVLTPKEVTSLASSPDAESLLKIAPAKRTPEQQAKIAAILLAPDPDYAKTTTDRDQDRKSLDALANDPRNTTMVMEELPKPRDTFILLRGQYDKHGEKVLPAIPAIFPPLPQGAPANRLGLAQWIVDPANPLTARVQANRLWEKFFGVGLVKTSENFGTQADAPSHPDLLDYLATELLRQHWDLKAFQKLIVTSAAYRQSSKLTPDLLEHDPENRLLARGPRFRLPAETVRDQALAVSGLLVEKIGGKSVKPYEPANVWAGNLYGNLTTYNLDTGDNLYRRSLYTFLKRTAAPPNLNVFDMPTREYCIVKRSRTNTPLQALDTLNDPTYVEAARALAQHMLTDAGQTPADRIAYGFLRATCRRPTDSESKLLQDALATQLDRYHKDPAAARKLISVGASQPDPKLDVSDLAAYTMIASVILNLDEMVNKP